MASKGNNGSKYRKASPLIPKSPTSPASSIASSYLSSSMGFGSTSKSAGRSTPTTPGSARNLPSFAIQSKSLQPYAYADSLASADFQKSKENVTVTVRFRPLNSREIQKGDEIAWYADGDTTVRNEYNPMTAYAFDRVFGPATTTRHVYDVAAQHVVGGAMEGVNGLFCRHSVCIWCDK